MKKLISTILLSSLSAFAFGQSTLITPTGDEILVTKYGSGATPNMLGRISGGSATTPTATPANLGLLTIAGRGYITGGWVGSNSAAINLFANQAFTNIARGTYINFQTTSDNTTSLVERMRINHNGNVGIGTNNPDSRLHLANTSTGVTAPANTLMTFENNGSVGLSFLSSSTGQSNITFGSSLGNARGQLSYFPTSNDMIFSTNALERMIIDGTGNVGIGTTSPARKLHIFNGSSGRSPNSNSTLFIEKNGNNYLEIASPDTGERGVMFSNPTDGNSGGIYYFNKDMYFNTNTNDRRMTILANGNVGIGTTTPDAKLDIDGNIRLGETLFTAGSTTYDPINPNGKAVLTFNPSGSATYTVKGITAPSILQSGYLLYITTTIGVTLVLKNENASSINNNIKTSTGADVTITDRGGATLMYVYDVGSSTGGWVMIGLAQ